MAVVQGQNVEVAAGQSCGDVLRGVLSGKKMKSVVACICDGRTLDLAAPVPPGTAAVEAVFVESPQYARYTDGGLYAYICLCQNRKLKHTQTQKAYKCK